MMHVTCDSCTFRFSDELTDVAYREADRHEFIHAGHNVSTHRDATAVLAELRDIFDGR